jgi:hypothetical protein
MCLFGGAQLGDRPHRRRHPGRITGECHRAHRLVFFGDVVDEVHVIGVVQCAHRRGTGRALEHVTHVHGRDGHVVLGGDEQRRDGPRRVERRDEHTGPRRRRTARSDRYDSVDPLVLVGEAQRGPAAEAVADHADRGRLQPRGGGVEQKARVRHAIGDDAVDPFLPLRRGLAGLRLARCDDFAVVEGDNGIAVACKMTTQETC